MAISSEEFGGTPPYHPDMSLPMAELLRLGMSVRPPASSRCFDELHLAAIADGRLDPAIRAEAFPHLSECGVCRRQLAALVALRGDPEISAELVSLGSRTRSWLRPALSLAGLAAAAGLLLIVKTPGPRDDPGIRRDPTITAVLSPVGVGPSGDVPSLGELRWHPVDGASSYRATLFDSTGTVLFQVQVSDTSAIVSDSLELHPHQTYLWKVEARTGWDRWSSSELYRFRIESRPAPAPSRVVPPVLPPGEAAPDGASSDSLTRLVARLSPNALARRVRTWPGDLRDAFRQALVRSVRADAEGRIEGLATARSLAGAFRDAWGDDFLVRETDRFTAWSPSQRETKIRADSIRLAGIATFGRDGPLAAIRVWRQAVGPAIRIGDTSGTAAVLGNIGAAFARESRLDSAEAHLVRARRLAEAVGDLRVAANAVSELAGLQEQREDVSGARTLYARAIALREKIGDGRGLAADYNNIASLSTAGGDTEDARRQLDAALALNRAAGRTGPAATNLVNLASLAAQVGEFARADADYREALAAWRSRGDSAETAAALSGLGEVGLRRGDYSGAAAQFTEAVRILDRTGPMSEAIAAHEQLASAFAAQGSLQQAADELRRAERIGDSLRAPPDVRAHTSLARAGLALQLNRLPDAETGYHAAISWFGRSGDRAGAAAARHGLGVLYLTQGELTRAAGALDAALKGQEAVDDRRGAAITRIALGNLAAAAGDSSGAARHLDAASTALLGLGDSVASAAALTERAALEAGAGRWAAAESLYRVALSRISRRQAPEIAWRLHAGLAESREALGDLVQAAAELRASIAEIERMSRSLYFPELRSGVLTDKWTVYQRLALLEQARGRVTASFAVSEALRARELAELMARGRIAAPRDTAADLIVREQDLRRRIAELTREMDEGGLEGAARRGPELGRSAPVPREALLKAQGSYASLQQEIRERAPRHAELISPRTASWQDVAARLGPDEAMLQYLLADAGSIVYVITHDTLIGVPLSASRQELAGRIDFVRGTLRPRAPVLDSMWRAPLRQLHRDLIQPVEAAGLLKGKTRLILVPHAELHYLPFAALLESERPNRFLVQRYQLSVTPSASAWIALGGRSHGRGSGALAMAPHPDKLPASKLEVAALSGSAGSDLRILTGGSATETAFAREARGRSLIHLATFGVLNKQNPLFSYVDLMSDGSSDGRLEAHEVFGLPLVADLVVLAACQTALASGEVTDVPPGDDWVGLARAFLSAGARSVMASLWAVDDVATAALMENFYRRPGIRGSPARALAEAQRLLLADPATAHPYYWAAFVVLGGEGQR